jgi:hypothetical protein
MERFNDRGESGLAVLGSVLSFSLGILYMGTVDAVKDDSESRVHQAQVYNEQLRPQLQRGDRLVAYLRVDDQGKHFTFDSKGREAQAQACRGDFKIEQGTATLAGKISCTEIVAIAK